MSHFVAYILQFQEIIVGGKGVYSQPKVYQFLTELCPLIDVRILFMLNIL